MPDCTSSNRHTPQTWIANANDIDTDGRRMKKKAFYNSAITPDSSDTLRTRRQLLRASLAAPMVATLQSGVAQANTSAFQCINADATESTDGDAIPALESATTDGWVRIQVWKYRRRACSSTGTNAVPAQYDWFFDIDGNGRSGSLYAADSTLTARYVSSSNPGTFWNGYHWKRQADNSTNSMQTYVLVMYNPSPAVPNATSATAGNPWPKDQIDELDQTQIALTGSCLCSVDPNSPICPL